MGEWESARKEYEKGKVKEKYQSYGYCDKDNQLKKDKICQPIGHIRPKTGEYLAFLIIGLILKQEELKFSRRKICWPIGNLLP